MILLNFNTIKWQDEITKNLKNSIKEKTLGHAVLFTGDVSTGVLLANATADSILCKEESGNACLKCSNCTKTQAGSHPDKYTIKCQKSSIGVDEIRIMINQMLVKPCNSEYKVFIFEDAHTLTEQAQNALLKILEQPPEYGTILLVSDKEESLLPTILSRVKKFNILQPSKEKVAEYLYVKFPEKKHLANFAATFCEGNPYDAEIFLLNDCDQDKRKRLLTFLQKFSMKEKSVIFDFSNYLANNKESLQLNINYLLTLLRDIIFIKAGFNSEMIINTDLYETIKKLSNKYKISDIEYISSALEVILENRKKNASLKLSITNELINIWEVLHDRDSRNQI